jgi:hypothetical protein
LLLRQCQRDEKVLYPLAEGNVVMMMKGGGYEKHVPTDILWDTACRKIYERRREYVTQMRHFQEAEACQKEVETIQKVMAEADEIGAKLDAAAAGGAGPEQPLEQASMPIAISPGRVLWVIVNFQRKCGPRLEQTELPSGRGFLSLTRLRLEIAPVIHIACPWLAGFGGSWRGTRSSEESSPAASRCTPCR